jgi:hypothetical protein
MCSEISKKPHCDLLVCIYTCESHRLFLEPFYVSPVFQFLRTLPNTTVLEVYADPDISRSVHADNRLVLCTQETYKNLPMKTFEMIRYCVGAFSFRRLLKIDVTTVMTRFEGREYEGRTPINLEALTSFLRQSPHQRDYDGFVFHAGASRENALTHATKKGGAIAYEKLFADGPMPPFFGGKCYFISWAFANFICQHGADTAVQFCKYMWGAEDVMIGRLFQEFERRPR